MNCSAIHWGTQHLKLLALLPQTPLFIRCKIKATNRYGGYSYRSYAPEHFKVLRGIVLIVTKLNQNLSAVPTAVILKLSGIVMRIFQYTGFRKLIAVNQNLAVYSLQKILQDFSALIRLIKHDLMLSLQFNLLTIPHLFDVCVQYLALF